MTSAALRAPHAPRSSTAWRPLLGASAGILGTDIVSSAVYYNGHTYIAYVDGDGNARVASYSHAAQTVATSPVIVSGLGADIHCTPGILIRQSDHKILLAVTQHSFAHLYVALSTNAEDVTAWGAATDIASTLGGTAYTYACLAQLSGESGKIYLFYRDVQASNTNVLCYSTSTDGGATWSAQTALYKNPSNQSYWVIASNGTARIDFACSDGSAGAGETSSLYHFYYSGGSYFKSDGTVISTALPLAPSNLTKLFDGATSGSVRVPYSILGGSSPVIAWAAFDTAGSGSNEHYWYAIYSGGAWSVNAICDAGSPPFTGFSEGGVMLDRIDPSRVYVSRVSSGLWQVFQFVTADSGATWTSTQLSSDTGVETDVLNLRPLSPLAAVSTLRCVWCFGPHYSLPSVGNGAEPAATQMRGYPSPV